MSVLSLQYAIGRAEVMASDPAYPQADRAIAQAHANALRSGKGDVEAVTKWFAQADRSAFDRVFNQPLVPGEWRRHSLYVVEQTRQRIGVLDTHIGQGASIEGLRAALATNNTARMIEELRKSASTRLGAVVENENLAGFDWGAKSATP